MVANKELNLAECSGGGGETKMQTYIIRTLASALNWGIGARVGYPAKEIVMLEVL
jgi:hypothetical protein